MAVTSSVVNYTMQTIQNLLHAVLAKLTHTHTKSAIFNTHTPIKFVMVQVVKLIICVPNSARNVKRLT